MTPPENLFSHIENLETGSLVLENPLTVPQDQGCVCRYALHRRDASVLAPDPQRQGLAAWHRLLPPPLAVDLPEQPVLWEGAGYEETNSLHLCFPGGLGKQLTQLMLKDAPDAKQGPWGNPFRLEAYKVLGLELMARYPGQMPTLLVADPTGELLLGLVLAGQHHTHFHAAPPFRLILVQSRPYHQLCQAFEGATPKWDNLDFAVIQPPNKVPGLLADALTVHLGTAIALDSHEVSRGVFRVALEKLRRTGFVDDEDQVIVLEPSTCS